jgi:hypothetical protein
MKKKILAVMATLLFITTFLNISPVSAIFFKRGNTSIVSETGDIGVFVFYRNPISTESEIIEITDASVTCEDNNGFVHILEYLEYSPGAFFYVGYDMEVGECTITVTKAGFETKTVGGIIAGGIFNILRIELQPLAPYLHQTLL